MSEIAIKIEHLSKVYKMFDKPTDRVKEALHPFGKRYSRDFYAMNDLCLEIKKGETVGIIGKNGAGKSTLLKMITGVLTPSGGSVQVNGRIASLLELGAGFNPEMSGIENIYLNGTVMGYTHEETESRLQDILDFADIGDFVYQPVKMYSSGMFARLAFAVNAFVDPDILIVDEALSVGDTAFQIKCMEKMKEMMEGGTTVLFVSHDINAIRRLCTRAVWFQQGRLFLDGEVNYVADKYTEYVDKRPIKKEKKEKKPIVPTNDMANIVSIVITDRNGVEKDVFAFDEEIQVTVEYEVKDETLESPVLGVAVFDANDNYVCGLNTLLDNKKIPWKKGLNKYKLAYPMGLRTLGGTFFFDMALEDQTASVHLQYLSRIRQITIESPYVSEGFFTIPHEWKNV